MKKKMVSVLLAAAMGTTALVGFGTTAYADDDVLEFYHGYYQDESEWAAAQVMRDNVFCILSFIRYVSITIV